MDLNLQLLRTKTNISEARPDFVRRTRLVERLNQGLRSKLILISAPAGFGKTTLLSDWTRQEGLPVAWLSLDREDNEPVRFWDYIILALQTVQASLGGAARAALRSSQPPPLEAIVTAIINEVANFQGPCLLILDDYHLIQLESIHTSLNFMIDHLPSQLHLVISTREDPPLFLSRRRGRGEMVEIRTRDLRFNLDESGDYLNQVHDLRLPMQDVAALSGRTEGWAVGLQLAALSLRTLAPSEKHEFVMAFSGNDRYVVDYLVEEVLQRLPPSTQSFLLQTSILEKLCPPLCDALLGRQDSQSILTELERTNLFIQPLDNQRYWYRYHRLFTELLRKRLEHSMDSQVVRDLYLKACNWLEGQGLIDLAVSSALISHQYTMAASLIERHVLATFYRGETRLVHTWLQALPESVLRLHPLLCAVYGTTIMLSALGTSRLRELHPLIDQWLQEAEAGLKRPGHGSEEANRRVPHYVSKVRAYLARIRGEDPQTVIQLTRQALERLPEDEPLFRSALSYNLGESYLLLGDRAAAEQAYEQSRSAGEASGDFFNASAAICRQAQLAFNAGHLHEAAVICQEGSTSIVRLAGGQPVPMAGCLPVLLGHILYFWNRLEEAGEALERGLAMLELASEFQMKVRGLCLLARIQQAVGNPALALQRIEQAYRIDTTRKADIEASQARIWLQQAESDPQALYVAVAWAAGRRLARASQNTWEQLTLARVLLAQARNGLSPRHPDEGELKSFLIHQLETVQKEGLSYLEMENRLLLALVYLQSGEISQALEFMPPLLRWAEQENCLRIFLDEGAPAAGLLRACAGRGLQPEFVGRLLALFGTGARALEGSAHRLSPLPEPLSARELEVLRMVAGGSSNVEIAERLCITLNTVKTHIGHIFDKLEVNHRAQAVDRAHRLKLIP